MSFRTFFAAAASAATLLAAAPAARAQTSATIGAPADPGLGYAGPFGAEAAGGTVRFAQTFARPTAGRDFLQRFTFRLGDFNPDGSGAGLLFRAAVYEVTGGQLGAQLFQSAVQSGSGNYTGFDAYTFTTRNLALTPGVATFALVLDATGATGDALDVVATGGADYAGGELFAVDAAGQLGGTTGTDAAFSATLTGQTVPEPGTVVLVGAGLAGAAAAARRRQRAA